MSPCFVLDDFAENPSQMKAERMLGEAQRLSNGGGPPGLLIGEDQHSDSGTCRRAAEVIRTERLRDTHLRRWTIEHTCRKCSVGAE